MPIYEYQCNACHHAFDKRQKMSDAPITTCPECGQEAVERLISAAGFQLKGTGWYETDFKNKPKAEQSEKPKKTEKTEKTEAKKTKKTGTDD